MKGIRMMSVAFVCLTLFACENKEHSQPANERATPSTTEVKHTAPPVKVDHSILSTIDWTESKTFTSGGYTMRGIPNKVGFLDAPFLKGKENKYMWHFWGGISERELTVVGVQKDSEKTVPVFSEGVWTPGIPKGAINGADAHQPSEMILPEKGKWALLVFLGKDHIGNIVVNVK